MTIVSPCILTFFSTAFLSLRPAERGDFSPLEARAMASTRATTNFMEMAILLFLFCQTICLEADLIVVSKMKTSKKKLKAGGNYSIA
jgi:hypothetical protein